MKYNFEKEIFVHCVNTHHPRTTHVSMYPLCTTNNIYNSWVLNSYFLFSQFLEAIFYSLFTLFTLSIGVIFIILRNNFSFKTRNETFLHLIIEILIRIFKISNFIFFVLFYYSLKFLKFCSEFFWDAGLDLFKN